MASWKIGLHEWILQDGNYADFHEGEVAEFGLEFWNRGEIQYRENTQFQASLIKECKYKVLAKVVYVDRYTWVIDFGLLAHSEHPPKGINVGSIISTDIWLGIDSYPPASRKGDLASIPLVYTWNRQSIIPSQDPDHIDMDNPDYILVCEKIDVPAKFTSVTAFY